MDSLYIRRFKTSITNFINESRLPEEVKRLVIGEIYKEIEETAKEQVNAELIAEHRKREGEKENAEGV